MACALLVAFAACKSGGGGQSDAQADSSASNTQANTAAATGAGLDGEIERLEKLAERNPGDDDARDRLATAYVRRADSLRASQQLKEALRDYQHALRINPDNEEAQKNAAEVAPLVEGTPQEGEYGEPPPLPITPNVTGGEEKATPTATPKKP